MTAGNDSNLNSKDESISLIIDGAEYHISGFFSINHADIFLSALAENKTPKRALASVISDKLGDNGHDVSSDKIESLPEEDFSALVMSVINDDASLKKHFDETDASLLNTERFAIAYKAYWEQVTSIPDSLKRISEIADTQHRLTAHLIPEIDALTRARHIFEHNPTIQVAQAAQSVMESYKAAIPPSITDSVISAAQQVSQALEGYANPPAIMAAQHAAQVAMESYNAVIPPSISNSAINAAQQLSQALGSYVNSPAVVAAQQVSQALGDFANSSLYVASLQAAQAAASIVAPIQESLGQFSSMLASTIAGLQLPEYSEEQRKELIESHKKWGEYGWSMLPHAPIKLFYECPDTPAEADKIALAHYKKKGLETLFDDLHRKRVRKCDLDEAIVCFQNRQYTACALILFSLIDAKLIRLHPKPQDDKRRKTGAGAIFGYKKKYEANHNIDELFFRAFRYFNLFKCLEKMFEDTKDFTLESQIVNRNYIGHGMNYRQTRRKDCVQLFLVLYNLLTFLEHESL